MVVTEFVLTEDHLKLIDRMYVGWSDVEFGAPEINPKRPYGNSFVEGDIAEILGWHWEEDVNGDVPEELYERAVKIHKETETALQIILVTRSFVPGKYVKTDRYDDRSWGRVVA
jgi:hypothetical protein